MPDAKYDADCRGLTLSREKVATEKVAVGFAVLLKFDPVIYRVVDGEAPLAANVSDRIRKLCCAL